MYRILIVHFTHNEVCSAQVQLINDAYNLVIDAMLGPEADCTSIKEPYSGILATLKQVKIPIASVDVPSGKCSCKPYIRLELQKHNMINEPLGSFLEVLAPMQEVSKSGGTHGG